MQAWPAVALVAWQPCTTNYGEHENILAGLVSLVRLPTGPPGFNAAHWATRRGDARPCAGACPTDAALWSAKAHSVPTCLPVELALSSGKL